MSAYTPVQAASIGKLPHIPGTCATFDLSALLGANATEVLIYSFATTQDATVEFRRLYYELFTTEGCNEYKQYMNIAVGPSIALNSENMWFPVPGEKILNVKLIDAGDNLSRKSIAYTAGNKCAKQDDPAEYSDVFVIGYR